MEYQEDGGERKEEVDMGMENETANVAGVEKVEGMEGGVENVYPNPNAIPFWFTHKQPPTPEQGEKYKAIHERAREFATFLESQLPGTSFEVSQTFARLEECVYWAVTAVSRHNG